MSGEAKPRILFVDDEANILHGLRRMLHSKRKQWDMVFAEGGEAALDALDAASFDIIISDLRMPGMDGLALLGKVRSRSPQTVRIALSGHADRDATLRAVSHIHQFLSKPCEPATLTATIEQALRLRELLADPRLRQIAAAMGTLPSLDTLHSQVVREIQKPDVSLRRVGELIAKDVGMSAKVVQLVNSCFFGLPHRVANPAQAVTLLGLDLVRLLVLSIDVFETYRSERLGGLDLDALWEHSVLVAKMSKRLALAELDDEESADAAFLAGLLHDVGKLVFAANMPEAYNDIAKLGHVPPKKILQSERIRLGAAHGEMGAYLLGLWGFPETALDAIVRHHEPAAAKHTTFSPLTAVYAANTLVHQLEDDIQGRAEAYTLDEKYLKKLQLHDRIPLWTRMCRETVGREWNQ